MHELTTSSPATACVRPQPDGAVTGIAFQGQKLSGNRIREAGLTATLMLLHHDLEMTDVVTAFCQRVQQRVSWIRAMDGEAFAEARKHADRAAQATSPVQATLSALKAKAEAVSAQLMGDGFTGFSGGEIAQLADQARDMEENNLIKELADILQDFGLADNGALSVRG